MCGRFTQHHDAGAIEERFNVAETLFDAEPRYNVAPQQTIAVVVAPENVRLLDGYRWGLIPFWAKEIGIGAKMINARAETVAEKPSFKNALARKRCLIPTDGFYEWDKAGGTKQPIHFRRRDGGLLAFAGLWDEWTGPDGVPLRTCTIITTTPNETVSPYHDRMPALLQTADDEAAWLDGDLRNADDLLPLLRPYPDDWMEAFAISKRVNTPANDDPDLLTPVAV